MMNKCRNVTSNSKVNLKKMKQNLSFTGSERAKFPFFPTAILFLYLQSFNISYGFGSEYLRFIWQF
jgi:hypothetical protein